MRAAQSLDQSDYQRLAEFCNRLRGFLKFSEHEAAKIGTLAERLGIRHNSAVELITSAVELITAKSEGPSKEPRVHA